MSANPFHPQDRIKRITQNKKAEDDLKIIDVNLMHPQNKLD